jgi:hypothetical protein
MVAWRSFSFVPLVLRQTWSKNCDGFQTQKYLSTVYRSGKREKKKPFTPFEMIGKMLIFGPPFFFPLLSLSVPQTFPFPLLLATCSLLLTVSQLVLTD